MPVDTFEVATQTSYTPCRLCVELLMLFCPVYTEDEGILLRYCDKPSLFGRIGKHKGLQAEDLEM